VSRRLGRGGPPVGEALRAALGSPGKARRLLSSPRSRVWLVEFDGAPAIVKQITDGAHRRAALREGGDGAAAGLPR
jgi:hypothetical protein